MGSTLIQAELVAWLRGHQWEVQNGYMPRAHAIIGDTPYFLGSIGKRFSGKDAKPAQYGKDGSFGRLSKGFMGKTWDGFESIYHYQDWVTEWAELLLDFVYPGGIIALFGGTRTYHRVAAGLENAGWELFDSVLAWSYGSGFPKAADIGKLIDKQAGADRQVVGAGKSQGAAGLSSRNKEQGARPYADGTPNQNGYDVTAPGTPLAARWEGFKTALKPAYEPIILARAPRGKLGYADLARQYGTGALNVDAARVGDAALESVTAGQSRLGTFERGVMITPERLGRYPSNMALVCSCDGYEHNPDCPVAILDAQSGDSTSSAAIRRNGEFDSVAKGHEYAHETTGHEDSGGASRFFYTAKAPSWEREAGLEEWFYGAEHVIIEAEYWIERENQWVRADQQVRLQMDTAQSPPKVIAVYGIEDKNVTAWNTMLFGNENTARSLRGMKCIIETKTNSITESKTLSYLTDWITNDSIPAVSSVTGSLISRAESANNLTPSITITSDQMVLPLSVGPALLPGRLRISVNAKPTPAKVNDGREIDADNAYQRGATPRLCGHPTVKPIQLVEWLGRLLIPPPLDEPRRALVLFAGVGSEMIGMHFAGWEDITGIEMEAEYTPINAARRAFWEQFSSYDAAKQFLNIPDPVIPAGQLNLFDLLDE